MKKIYNNLTIDSLMKTDWFEQFYIHQKHEILNGIRSNVDIFIYAKSEYNSSQMEEIRLGLEMKLDVFIYAKPELDFFQMREIRLGLEKNLDVSVYAKEYFNWKQMRKIRLGLEENKKNVLIYAKIKYYLNKIKGKLSKKKRN